MSVPKESIEQERLANRLDANNYVFSAIRNESDYNNIAKGAKRKREGVRKGISDFCIILKCRALLFVELKRQRKVLKSGKLGVSPSKVSEEQIRWIDACNEIDNVGAVVCYGAEEAIHYIKELEEK